jgi:kynureninase
MSFQYTREYALAQDQQDPLSRFRNQFHIPLVNDETCVYFTGNSLGLQPKNVADYIHQELEDWKTLGVEGHFHAKRPWMPYHEFFAGSLGNLVGAKPTEVVAMGTLTNNLHLLMVSFYQPKGRRIKILCESKAFPSDQYALASQARFHGYDPQEVIVEIAPREGEHTIRTADVLQHIADLGDELALVMIGGVNYYTGQVHDMQQITATAREKGAFVGWDLAHGIGNVELKLHDWGADFAAWCSYKYLNSGPGSVAGIFIHERHHGKTDIPRFEGWWGHETESRFNMPDKFVPMPTAEAWQLSNAPVLAMAPHRASLDLFDQTTFDQRREKAIKLSGFLEFVLDEIAAKNNAHFEIITPREWNARGSQLSVFLHGQGRELFNKLLDLGVIADWREPNVIRMAPVPLYNSFEDIWRFGQKLEQALTS